MKDFESKYDELIKYIKENNSNCTIVLCNCCPRGDTDTTTVNNVIYKLSKQHGAEYIDMDRSFQGQDGVNNKYLSRDGIHLSHSGIKRFLGTLNVKFEVVDNFDNCVFVKKRENVRSEPQNNHRSTYANFQSHAAHRMDKIVTLEGSATNAGKKTTIQPTADTGNN